MAFDDCVGPKKRERRKRPEKIVDLTLSETASNINDEDDSPSKRRRTGDQNDSNGGPDHESFRSMLSIDQDKKRDVGHQQQQQHADDDSDPDSILNGNRDDFLSVASLRSAATNVRSQQQYHKHLRADYVVSAKIDKIMSLLTSIREGRPKEKTLVFSLWPSFLDLLEIAIEADGFVHGRYDGQMNPDDRYASVQNFQENPAVEVMLVSLTAGNAGLNLTAATQVIIVEPFWNPYVEEQAIDRAHRIGQTRAVTVHRVLIKGTVEDRILSLQEKKKNLVNAALGERGANQAGRLTLGELQGLFGV